MIILPELHNIGLFIAAATIVIIIPGPAVLYIMAKSAEQGYKAGIFSVLGIGVGGLFHVFAASIGLSALLVASATAFSIIKYLGALYLIYLGIKKLFDKSAFIKEKIKSDKKKHSKIFFEGVIVNILNPKAAIFFFAFLPQFISPEKGGATSQILFLGAIFIIIAVTSDIMYVFISGKISKWVKKQAKGMRFSNYIIGSIYIFLGILTLSINKPANSLFGKN